MTKKSQNNLLILKHVITTDVDKADSEMNKLLLDLNKNKHEFGWDRFG